MRHFHRTALTPDQVLEAADHFFPPLGLASTAHDSRTRAFGGALGALHLRVRMEGGHYTLVEAETDQVGESRLDKNVKKYFLGLHRQVDPNHRVEAAY